MLPPDSDTQRMIAAERAELLRSGVADARSASGPRRRLGAMLITAGLRLAPEAAPRLIERDSTVR
jgi:hypothetical protein